MTSSSDSFAPASVFQDRAVLQRDIPIPVWGRGPARERVLARLAGAEAETGVNPESGF